MNQIVDGAHSVLDSGDYSESLGEIITAQGRNEFEMNAMFATALNELEMLLPTTEQAIEELAASFLVPLAEGLWLMQPQFNLFSMLQRSSSD